MIEKNILGNTDAQNCFKYLKQLAEVVSIANEGERSFLFNLDSESKPQKSRNCAALRLKSV